MFKSKLVKCGCLIIALALLGQIGSHLVVVAATRRAKNSSLTEDTFVFLPFVSVAKGNYYYVDSVNGSDSNPGTSEAEPWRTLAPVHAADFSPGSVVHFKRGSSWSGGLVINDSGTENNPITFTAYGSGYRPVIRNPGGPDNWTVGVSIKANWVIVEGLLVQDTCRGVLIRTGSDNNIVRDIEATDVGIGVTIDGQYNLVTRNYVHDLHMMRNTPGGDDDFGALGISLHSSHNEVSYNVLENCIAPSYDYGTDGGGFALQNPTLPTGMESNYIHHNWVIESNGFLEVGSGLNRDTIVAYNVSINNGKFSWIHLEDTFAATLENFRVENNTIVETEDDDWVIFGFRGEPDENAFLLRNNMIYVDKHNVVSNESSFTHDHNLYYLAGGTQLGFPLGTGEQIADPLFVNLAGKDFHLQPWSPAIDAGIDLRYTLDFDDNSVPAGAASDLGAFEYQPNPNEFIIDDTDPEFSTSFSQDPWQVYTDPNGQHCGGTHYYNLEIGTGEDTATWSFSVPNPGRYEVYAWWWEWSFRPTDVPYTINHVGGSTTVRVDQQTNGGQWNILGTFEFQDQGSVTVSDDVSSGEGLVADAIRLVYLEFLISTDLISTPTIGPTFTPTPTPAPPMATPTPTHTPTSTPTPTNTPTASAPATPAHTPTLTATPAWSIWWIRIVDALLTRQRRF